MPKPQSAAWYGWKKQKPDYRDKEFKPTAIRLPAEAYLDEKFLPPIRNQGNLGSCTGHALTGAASFARTAHGQPFVNLSPMFAYYMARYLEGTVDEDSGAELRDVVKGAHNFGACTEELCPYVEDNFAHKPTDQAYAEAKDDILTEYRLINPTKPVYRLRSFKEAIVRGQPFVFGFSVFANFEDDAIAKTGVMEMPQGQMVGGHAVWGVGYSNARKAFKIANSWDTDWGDAGYFWMPYEFISDLRYADDFWALKMVS